MYNQASSVGLGSLFQNIQHYNSTISAKDQRRKQKVKKDKYRLNSNGDQRQNANESNKTKYQPFSDQ